MREQGASMARVRLLNVLACDGPRIMSDVGETLGVTARNVTALVDALEADGLVRRAAHPSDRRATLLELTAMGSDLHGRVFDEHRQAMAALFETLLPADQQRLLRLIGDLTAELSRRSEG